MSTPTKEYVAIAHPFIGVNEQALKELTIMFNRIGIQSLPMDPSKMPFISPDFIKLREWLAELGILFDLDLDKLKSSTALDQTGEPEHCLLSNLSSSVYWRVNQPPQEGQWRT